MKTTEQMNFWLGQCGQDCTDRNTCSAGGIDQPYEEMFGLSRSAMKLLEKNL